MSLLLGAQSLRCSINQGTQASWDTGELSLKSARFAEDAEVVFDAINTETGKARIIGNAGAGDLLVTVVGSGIMFVEFTPVGNVNITTVFASYDSAQHFIAVESRHQYIAGPFPSQYHGTCTILE